MHKNNKQILNKATEQTLCAIVTHTRSTKLRLFQNLPKQKYDLSEDYLTPIVETA